LNCLIFFNSNLKLANFDGHNNIILIWLFALPLPNILALDLQVVLTSILVVK